jgi:hypothetical protein
MIAGEKLRFREVRRSVFRVQFSPGIPNAAKVCCAGWGAGFFEQGSWMNDFYAPPMAVVADVPEVAAGGDFHVVGKVKFFTLYLGTFGFYMLVWMYQHWAQFKHRRKVPMWPVARAIFPIFFTHSLTEEIDHDLKRAGIRYAWSPSGLATIVVVLMIANRILGRLPDEVVDDTTALVISMALVGLLSALLWRIQRAANLACGDPEGASNRRFGVVNWLVAVLAGGFWILVFAGLFLV